jgi:pectin methylesterase-like acyl-CoA thioesterase
MASAPNAAVRPTSAPAAAVRPQLTAREGEQHKHGLSPNGQAVIRNSEIGPHIRKADPWGPAASTNRAYNATDNRFAEYQNTGPESQ